MATLGKLSTVRASARATPRRPVGGDRRVNDPEAIGRYKVLRRLGMGGMGAVYLARSPGGLNVAIKVIRPEFTTDPQFRTRSGGRSRPYAR
jgi:serine/threonine protein kinase